MISSVVRTARFYTGFAMLAPLIPAAAVVWAVSPVIHAAEESESKLAYALSFPLVAGFNAFVDAAGRWEDLCCKVAGMTV